MTRRLMQTAWYDLKVAKDNLNEADEIALLISAYHLSQAAGKVVKSVLREMGLSYAKTHRISDLLNDLPEDQDFFTDEQLLWFETYSPMLYEWENRTRYDEEYVATRRMILKMLKEVSQLYADILEKFRRRDEEAAKQSPRPEPPSGFRKMSFNK